VTTRRFSQVFLYLRYRILRRRCVLPIMRGHPKIYATVDDIQALDDQPDLVQKIVAEIVERLSREARSKESQQKWHVSTRDA
jgi:hypothetical protein